MVTERALRACKRDKINKDIEKGLNHKKKRAKEGK